MISFRATGIPSGRSPLPRRILKPAILSASLLCGALLAGCANPGVPRPPSLHLPAVVTDLSAQRVGDRVKLHWTAPARTTDGLELTATTVMTVEICRDPRTPKPKTAPPTPPAPPCTVITRQAAQPGENTAVDTLPASVIAEAATRPVLAYRVRILNGKGRSADPSAPALVPAGPAAVSIEDFRATQSSAGVVLDWQRQSAAGKVEVVREQTLPPGRPAPENPPPVPKPTGKAAKKAAPGAGGFHSSKSKKTAKPGEVRLRQSDVETPTTGSRDGMIDADALPGQKYTYRAERVETIKAGGQTIEFRSEPTAEIAIDRLDTFPPAPPTGLASVPGTLREAGTEHQTIDLSWEPNVETDLAGYNVYRTQSGTSAPPEKLNPALLIGPAFRDTAAASGVRYVYRVTAVDRTGNESKPGAAIEDSIQVR